MPKYAVIRIQGKQFKVSETEEILVDRVQDPTPEVLLVVEEEMVLVGKPLVAGARVKIKSIGDLKGEKIDVFKYKAKSRYRKRMGFRPSLTKILIEKITT